MATTDQPGTPNDGCGHKRARHRHGTHACYVLDLCRCDECRAAHTRYEKQRLRWVAGVLAPPMVDAAPVRAHIRRLMSAGMGLDTVAARAGVGHTTLGAIVYGRADRPTRRVRREVAARILAVIPDLADGAKVPAGEAWRIVSELVARGWTRAAIGRRIHGPHAMSLQLGAREVTAGNLRTLRALLREPVPPRRTRYGDRPARGRPPRPVPATTPGVPEVEPEPMGHLVCRVCGRPLADHALTEACWRSIA